MKTIEREPFAHAARDAAFVWPLGRGLRPDEMNTSYGPRIDADTWDFHDGIDLPAPVGTAVHAMADGVVHRAGPADKTAPGRGFGSTHVLLRVRDPRDGRDDLFLVHLHLDSIAEGVVPGAPVRQGDVIGAVGQEDATYPHLHVEFRKGEPKEDNSIHPLNLLPYTDTRNVSPVRLDRCNFTDAGAARAVRLRFELPDRHEGDLRGVDVELSGNGVEPRTLHVDFDDRATIVSDKGDQHEFNAAGIAVEGYQKSNLKGDGLIELHYGVIVRDIAPAFERVKVRPLGVRRGRCSATELALPVLDAGQRPVDSRVGFESLIFPPRGWEVSVLPGNTCQADAAAALSGTRGLLCEDHLSARGPLIRAALRFALPIDRSADGRAPMSWRLKADIRVAKLQMASGLVIHPLALIVDEQLLAAACLRKIGDQLVAGVVMRSADGLLRERIDAIDGEVPLDAAVTCELDLLRLGTRQTTAVLSLDRNVVARVDGDTSSVEPETACVGIAHRNDGLQASLHFDQLLLTEALP
jgi:Peptidase family M23